MIQVQGNQHTAGKSHGKPKDVDKREDLIFLQVSPGNFKIVPEHSM
jgi:hypothetical protein